MTPPDRYLEQVQRAFNMSPAAQFQLGNGRWNLPETVKDLWQDFTKQYWASETWKQRSRWMKVTFKNLCHDCVDDVPVSLLEVHHLKYPLELFSLDHPQHLVVVCPDHHEDRHKNCPLEIDWNPPQGQPVFLPDWPKPTNDELLNETKIAHLVRTAFTKEFEWRRYG